MLPPLPQFFADVAWLRMAAFSQKTGGEGSIGHLLPDGEKGRHFTQQILKLRKAVRNRSPNGPKGAAHY
jgi:hypothetical protein